MSESKTSQFYTVSAAARILEVSPSTIWRWIQSQKLPAYRIGPKKIRIRKEDLGLVISPARGAGRGELSKMNKGGAPFEPPGQDELERRQALVARILAKRKERVIAPRTTADLVREVREQERKSFASR